MITRTQNENRPRHNLLDRRALAQQAMLTSLYARTSVGFDLESPICIYALSEAHGVTVHFNSINMEGTYQRIPKPRIHLSALRPLGRRAFNCAHELGHHLFGHGSTIDEIREEAASTQFTDPAEFIADVFGGFVMMPTIGVRSAFTARGLHPETATPVQAFAIACNFGVGYATLINHLAYSAHDVSSKRALELLRTSPKAIRAQLLGDDASEPLILVDYEWNAPTLDAEIGMNLLLPHGTEATGESVTLQSDLPAGRLFRAERSGIARFHRGSWAAFVRVSRAQYVGLARYRHLEDVASE